MRRDTRDPMVVYTASDGYRDTGFAVVPAGGVVRIGAGHYVLVPVLNEQAGDELIKRLRDQPS